MAMYRVTPAIGLKDGSALNGVCVRHTQTKPTSAEHRQAREREREARRTYGAVPSCGTWCAWPKGPSHVACANVPMISNAELQFPST